MRLTVVLCAAWLGFASLACDAGETRAGGGAREERPATENRSSDHDVSCDELASFIERTRRGYVPVRSADLALIPHEPTYIGRPTSAVHSGPYDFLAEVPLVLFGPGHIRARGSVNGAVTMADVAPTVARLIGFDDFEAADGRRLDVGPQPVTPPRLVVTVVWDGGGWNTLHEHPGSWPFLESMIDRGISFEDMTVGSTPTNTPPVHTTLGTGAFPARHRIPNVRMMTAEGDYIDPFEDNSARRVAMGTLADIYDKAAGNAPLVGLVATVNWHLGMMGKGAVFPGGDRDLAALINSSGYIYGNSDEYELPVDLSDPTLLAESASTLDARDGAPDGQWRGHALSDLGVRYASPAWVRFQQTILERMIESRGFGADDVPDLLFTNYKSIDKVGHLWGMASTEEADVIRATDDALRALVRFLNRRVGKRQWVVIVTADHGTAQFARDSGAWAVSGDDLRADLNREFAIDGAPAVERINAAGIYLNDDVRGQLDIDAMAEWLLRYTASDNLRDNEVPAYYAGKEEEPLFDAVLFGDEVVARSCRR